MIRAVANSGPLIHLAIVGQTALLPRYVHPILIVPQVYEEVVTQGRKFGGVCSGELRKSYGYVISKLIHLKS